MRFGGRIDLTLEDERTALFHMGRELKHLQDAYRFVPGAFSVLALSLMVRTDHPQQATIIAAFIREIEAMLADGICRDIPPPWATSARLAASALS